MPKRNLTAAAVSRIKPPAKGQVDHFDAGHPGLALRVSHGGRRTWTYFYRNDGKQRRMSLGIFPAVTLAEAREKWRDARNQVEAGIDPAEARKQPKPHADTFAHVFEQWMNRDQAKNKSADEVRRIIEKDAVPALGDREIDSISRRDALELMDAIADRGATTLARRIHAHLHRMFRWSVGRGIIESNPFTDLPKPGKEVRRDRVLDDRELVVIWKAATAIGAPFEGAVKLLTLTAARRDEIGELMWSEIDFDQRQIKLEGSRTKTNEARIIPLSDLAVQLLQGTPRISGCDYAFSTTGRTAISGWSKAKKRLDAAATDIAGEPLEAWRIHDLRRTAATGLQRLGTPLEVTEDALGHRSGSRSGIVQVYQTYRHEKEVRVALEKWTRYIEGLLGGEAGKVVAFPVTGLSK